MVTVESVKEVPPLYLIDTGFNETPEYVGVFLLDGKKPVLLDAGTSTTVDRILEGMVTAGFAPEDIQYILLSHIHLDHAGGASHLLDVCENATVVCHRDAVSYLTDPEKVARLEESAHRAVGELAGAYGTLEPISTTRVKPVSPGDSLDLGNRTLNAVKADGHSPNHLAFWIPQEGLLYVGDAAGMWIRGTVLPATPPPAFNLEATLKTLRDLRELDFNHLLYPHFGVRNRDNRPLDEYETILVDWINTVEETRNRIGDRDAVLESMVERELPHYEVWDRTTARQVVETDTNGVLDYLDDGE